MSYDDEQMRPVRTGAARIALEVEHRHDGRLGLRIAPVGLTYAAKGRYRSDVLVHFGEPFQVVEWLEAYRADAYSGVRALTQAIDRRIRALIVDLPTAAHQRIVASVKRLYLDRLRADNPLVTTATPPRAEELILSQAIAQALRHFEEREPARLAAFVRDLHRYESRLWMAGVSDAAVADFAVGERVARPGALRTLALVAGAPIAIYGWVHRLAPVWFTEWAVEKFSPPGNKRAQVAHGSMIAGLVGFGALYAVAAGAMGMFAGWKVAAVYLLSLPPTGLFAFHYVRAVSRYARHFRSARIMLRLPLTRRHLARLRTRLIAEIDAFRADYRRTVLKLAD